jgi:hypothetical protein
MYVVFKLVIKVLRFYCRTVRSFVFLPKFCRHIAPYNYMYYILYYICSTLPVSYIYIYIYILYVYYIIYYIKYIRTKWRYRVVAENIPAHLAKGLLGASAILCSSVSVAGITVCTTRSAGLMAQP